MLLLEEEEEEEEDKGLLLLDDDVHCRHCCCHHKPRSSQNLRQRWLVFTHMRKISFCLILSPREARKGTAQKEERTTMVLGTSLERIAHLQPFFPFLFLSHLPCTHSLLHCFGTSSTQYCPCQAHHVACSSSHFCTTGLMRIVLSLE